MSSTPWSKNNVIAPAMPVLFRNSLSHRSQNSHMAIKKAQSVTNILQDDLSNNNNRHTHKYTHTQTYRDKHIHICIHTHTPTPIYSFQMHDMVWIHTSKSS